jgi:hypothetical protein
MLRRVALVRTYVSEEPSASFIRVTSIGELGTIILHSHLRENLKSYVGPISFVCIRVISVSVGETAVGHSTTLSRRRRSNVRCTLSSSCCCCCFCFCFEPSSVASIDLQVLRLLRFAKQRQAEVRVHFNTLLHCVTKS